MAVFTATRESLAAPLGPFSFGWGLLGALLVSTVLTALLALTLLVTVPLALTVLLPEELGLPEEVLLWDTEELGVRVSVLLPEEH